MAKELRITFKESESYLYEYIKDKSSPSAFLKDLAKKEKKHEDFYFNNSPYNSIIEPTNVKSDHSPSNSKSVADLDISDLD